LFNNIIPNFVLPGNSSRASPNGALLNAFINQSTKGMCHPKTEMLQFKSRIWYWSLCTICTVQLLGMVLFLGAFQKFAEGYC